MIDFGSRLEKFSRHRVPRTSFISVRIPILRERYGFHAAFDPGASNRCGCPAWSQRILLAPRLEEAGVLLVNVDLRWRDTHVLGFYSLRRGFLSRWEQACTVLIEDLEQLGLLEKTWLLREKSSAGRRGSIKMLAVIIIRMSSARP